jgi:hypothetical protein
MTRRFFTCVIVPIVSAAVVALVHVPVAGQSATTRTRDGHSDLQGVWNAATITPLERPAEFAGKALITEAEAAAYAQQFLESNSLDRRDGGPERDRSRAYPNLFVDRGTALARIDNRFQTSLVVDPADGRIPPLTAEGQRRAKEDAAFRAASSDAAESAGNSSLDAYADPELRPLAERCLLSFGSSSGPPSLPVLYNNYKQIVQTRDYVMILYEMDHDIRIIPFDRPHAPSHIRKWFGDSVAHWEGDTLVIDTTNFTDKTRFRGSTANLHIVERLKRVDADTILYRFTVDDPATWTKPWTGEYPWVATSDPLYEYACHEGNYAFGDILRGARLLEREAAAKSRP